MQLTPEALMEFEKLWVEENPGVLIEEKKIAYEAIRILSAVKLIYKQIPKQS